MRGSSRAAQYDLAASPLASKSHRIARHSSGLRLTGGRLEGLRLFSHEPDAFLTSWLGAPISSIPLFLSYEISSGSYWRGPDACDVLPVRLADCTPPTP
ncbi:MAG: hypothetical protein J4F49_09415 [Rhodobacteraceae bacterium]|nr:hypothetical protein [Paracoccaceae bacterium]